MQIPTRVQAQSSSALVSDTKSVGAPDTQIIPSLSVAERYDSNVYFVRGENVEDYVTTVSPQLTLSHRNQWVDGVVSGGAVGAIMLRIRGSITWEAMELWT